MRRGDPTITAPLSRKKRSNGLTSSPVGMTCAILSAILAFGGTVILAMAMISSAARGSNPETKETRGRKALRNAWRNPEPERKGAPSDAKNDVQAMDVSNAQGVVVHTHLGDIRIHFTPELSGEGSINYVKDIVQAASKKQNSGTGYNNAETMDGRRITEGFMCQRCKFYRAEKQLLLQGVMDEPSSVPKNKMKGPCPMENYVPKLKCPEHDPNCGCHGPIMTKGMVGWAGGGTGPDFFINTFKKPVDWWENQHTVWGEIRDDESMKVVEGTYDLPAHMSGMRYLDQQIEFSLELF